MKTRTGAASGKLQYDEPAFAPLSTIRSSRAQDVMAPQAGQKDAIRFEDGHIPGMPWYAKICDTDTPFDSKPKKGSGKQIARACDLLSSQKSSCSACHKQLFSTGYLEIQTYIYTCISLCVHMMLAASFLDLSNINLWVQTDSRIAECHLAHC